MPNPTQPKAPMSFSPPPDEILRQARAEKEASARKMSPESQAGLQQLDAVLSQQKPEPMELPGPEGDAPVEKREEEPAEDDDSFTQPSMRYAYTEMDNPKIRKEIEGRCGPMDFDAVISTGKVEQDVPIYPERLKARYQTVSPNEDMEVKQILSEMVRADGVKLDLYVLMRLALGLKSVNGRALAGYLNPKGEFDVKLFEQRWRALSKMGEPLVEVLVVNQRWFEARARRSLVYGALKNG